MTNLLSSETRPVSRVTGIKEQPPGHGPHSLCDLRSMWEHGSRGGKGFSCRMQGQLK